jgi:hypothetical protein
VDIETSNTLAFLLICFCCSGLFCLGSADNWHIETRVKLAFILVIVLALAIMGMR